MEHLKKYWGWYLGGIIILIIVGYQMKWFGNTKGFFMAGGITPGPTPLPVPVVPTPRIIVPTVPVVPVGNCDSINARLLEIAKSIKGGSNINNYRSEINQLQTRYNSLNCVNPTQSNTNPNERNAWAFSQCMAACSSRGTNYINCLDICDVFHQ